MRYTTLEDMTVAATIQMTEGISRRGIELLNDRHLQENVCLEGYCFIGKEKKWAEFEATTTPWCVSLRAGNERKYQWCSHAQHVLEENGVG